MKNNFSMIFTKITLLMSLWGGYAQAGYLGTFSDDKDLAFFKVVADGTTQNTLQSYAYLGGMMTDATVVNGGGFDAMLTLYDGSGNIIDPYGLGYLSDDNGPSPDPYYQDILAAGTYWLALGLSYNFGNAYLGGGFAWDAVASSTPSADTWFCSPAGPFMDSGCNARTGNWALDILGFSSVEEKTLADVRAAFPSSPALPEPSTLALFSLVLPGLMRKRAA